MAIDWQGLWGALSDPQRRFLETIYNADQDRTAHYRRERFMFDPIQKGGEWRWVAINGIVRMPIGGAVKQTKRDRAMNKVLEEMGYIEQRWKDKEYTTFNGLVIVNEYSVRLTRRGRQLVRTILEGPLVRNAKAKAAPVEIQEADPDAEGKAARKRLGGLLKAKRGTRMLSEVAWEMGEQGIGVVGPATLARMENGAPCDIGSVKRVCCWLEVSADNFLGEGAAPQVAWNPDGCIC